MVLDENPSLTSFQSSFGTFLTLVIAAARVSLQLHTSLPSQGVHSISKSVY